MDYVVIQTNQIAVTASNPKEAQLKVLNGEGTIISSTLGANPRPESGQSTTGQITGSMFQRTTTQPTPALNG